MPRLPTIRVIGSHAISTSPSPAVARGTLVAAVVILRWPPISLPLLPVALVTAEQLLAPGAPLGLVVHGVVGDLAKPSHGGAEHARSERRHPGARRLVHERHELVREPWHRAPDADPPDVRAAAHPVHPTPLGHVAVDDRSPAAELDDALWGAVLAGEVALLVVAGAVAAVMDGGAEQPPRAELVVQGDHGRLAGRLVQEVEDRL